MGVWFEGSIEIDCALARVQESLADMGEHFVGVVASMPGMTEAVLVEHGEGVVKIRTNEGMMTRTNIESTVESDRVVITYDELYEAGRVAATTHFSDEYRATETGVEFNTTVSDVHAPGFLGFLYRTFGARNMGKAFLSSQKTFLEA